MTPSRGWIDVTVPLRDGMVHWPNNPEVHVTQTMALERGDSCTVSALSLGAHTGTHVDSPAHFLAGAPGVDALPLDILIGPARVVEINHPRVIPLDELHGHRPQFGERILFKTANSQRCWGHDQFVQDYVSLSLESARRLVERGVRLVGVDYLSVAGLDNAVEIHRTLLEAGIIIIEGLDLSAVTPGHYDLVALPLRLADGDGAPARVVLRPSF